MDAKAFLAIFLLVCCSVTTRMTDLLGIAPVLLGGLLSACIMYIAKNPRLRDSQGKFLGFLIVVLGIGVLVIVSGYRGLLSNPFSTSGVLENHPLTPSLVPGVPSMNRPVDIPSVKLVEKNSNPEEYFYGIMFDAGSTGSRIHCFKFRQAGPGKPFEFVEELFEKIQPGLSSYADNPKEAANSLKGMMDKAKDYIPQTQWAQTPIALKATAGLRKLKEEEADNILNEVRQLFIDYPFKQENDSVVIMEGTDEGVFSWFTVNFYAGVLGDSERMQGVMDLGGGSTQITFTPKEKETISSAPSSYLSDHDILGKQFKLYTHSYLDLGLMAGRLQVMGGKVGVDEAEANGGILPVLTSPCFPEKYSGKIEFGQDEYTIKATPPSISRFDDCYAVAKKVIQKYDIHSTKEIQNKGLCAISYYFDKGVEAELIDAEKGGHLKVSDFSTAASKVCSNATIDKPFLCLDLCYISALLNEGFKMQHDNSLTVVKKINNQEISWALGGMFDFFGRHKLR